MALTITPFERGFGAEISGIAPNREVSAADFQRIADAWTMHSILRFRGLAMTPQEHVSRANCGESMAEKATQQGEIHEV